MARRVFFSFHYERDNQRASVVRNSDVTKDSVEGAGFIDAADWEKVEKEGEDAIKKWIADQLHGTTITIVLIGAETSGRKWVRYELQESYKRKNGMLGIYINNIKDWNGNIESQGSNQFGELGKDEQGKPVYFWDKYHLYDWEKDKGYENLGKWIEAAVPKN